MEGMGLAVGTQAATPPYLSDVSLASLFEEHAQALLGMAWPLVGDLGTAEDVVQEAFIRLPTAWPRLREQGRVVAYLRSTVLNLARAGHRHHLVVLRHPEPVSPDSESAEERSLLREDQRQVVLALRRLPARQRECLVLRYYAELHSLEIAQTLGISVNSVKTHLARGLDALERLLGGSR
jgi:RNA polymerase sigma-70 factor (ECF subfamily)